MNRKVYFGNGTKQTWIPAPLTGLAASTTGFSVQNQLLNGRAILKRSSGSHRLFEASWVGPMNAEAMEDSLHTIKDFADGLYGQGPFYWLDPYAIDTNLLPPHWAAPMLSANGWPPITSIGISSLGETFDNTKNYPYQSLIVASEGGIAESSQSIRIIIPEGHKFHFGWHGARESSGMTVVLRAYERATGDNVDFNTTELSTASPIRTNRSISGNTYSMVDIFIADTTGDGGAMAIAGMIAQVLPETAFPEQGDFISGRGTSALDFSTLPSFEYYSANVNNGQVGLTASFLEV